MRPEPCGSGRIAVWGSVPVFQPDGFDLEGLEGELDAPLGQRQRGDGLFQEVALPGFRGVGRELDWAAGPSAKGFEKPQHQTVDVLGGLQDLGEDSGGVALGGAPPAREIRRSIRSETASDRR